ncbi:hypothetical protein LLE87_27970, partial [Paenibacillus polymyxa]|nr:hypothetical protein [Paenibacillus polymyxa]
MLPPNGAQALQTLVTALNDFVASWEIEGNIIRPLHNYRLQETKMFMPRPMRMSAVLIFTLALAACGDDSAKQEAKAPEATPAQ